MGFAQTAAASKQICLYIFSSMQLYIHTLFACLISIGRFYREAVAGEISGQINFKNTFLKVYFKEPATAFFRAEWDSHLNFGVFLKVLPLGGYP